MNYKIEMRKGLYILRPKYFNKRDNLYNYIDNQFKNNLIDYVEVYFKDERDFWILLDTHDN
ncbi:MAG: hypothetical protein RBR50_07475 [Candidatus Izemoplasmatales bacterium]|nr:hypothetical protein [Candidatus Izemoplasmatales bacterium]